MTQDTQQPSTTLEKKYARRSRIKRGPDSFRFGQTHAQANVKASPINLIFSIPSSASIGTDDELTEVREFVKAINSVPEHGNVISHGIVEGNWEIVVPLKVTTGTVDEALTAAQHAFKDVVQSSSMLKTGFVPSAKPTWACKQDDFVFDEGPC